MNSRFASVALLVAIGGVASAAACSDRTVPIMKLTNAQLHDSLVSRLAKDQAMRDTFMVTLKAKGRVTNDQVAAIRALDSSNTVFLRPLIEENGFPTKAMIGADGVQAAFVIIQHADNTPDFQNDMLPLLEKAYTAGEVAGPEVAMLADRVAKSRGYVQSYGTQTTVINRVPVIDPIIDSAHVDERRKRIGLMPLAEYKRQLDSAMANPGKP